MAMTKHDLLLWLADVKDDTTLIAVDDGGLTLVAQGTDAYLEVGGIYQEPDDETGINAGDCECQDCGERFYLSELKPIEDYWQRVEEGEPEPAGECPDCGALCHKVADKP
jgi:hypothetical protein